jgi:hypothetical protein
MHLAITEAYEVYDEIIQIDQNDAEGYYGKGLALLALGRYHDLTAGLFAPVEMLLMEQESGDGSTVLYDLPSSLMRVEQNPAIREAASVLDQKVQALVSRATGVDPAKQNVATKR